MGLQANMNEKSETLHAYWESIRGGRLLPYRREVDPAAFSRLLDSVFILEIRNDREVIYRLAGTALCNFSGVELRGMSYLSFWDQHSRDRVSMLLERVCTQPCVGNIVAAQDGGPGSKARLETVFLPLKDDNGLPNRILGYTSIQANATAMLSDRTASFQRLESATASPVEQMDFDSQRIPRQRPIGSRQIPKAIKRIRSHDEADAGPQSGSIKRLFRVIDGGLQ